MQIAGCLALGGLSTTSSSNPSYTSAGFRPSEHPLISHVPCCGLVCSIVLARPLPGWRCVEVCTMLLAAMTDGEEGGFREVELTDAVMKDRKVLLRRLALFSLPLCHSAELRAL